MGSVDLPQHQFLPIPRKARPEAESAYDFIKFCEEFTVIYLSLFLRMVYGRMLSDRRFGTVRGRQYEYRRQAVTVI